MARKVHCTQHCTVQCTVGEGTLYLGGFKRVSDFRKYLTLFRLWGNRFAYVWADLRAAAKSKGIDIPLAEGMIAAIAKRHELVMATRNVGDFKHTKVETVNPYETKG